MKTDVHYLQYTNEFCNIQSFASVTTAFLLISRMIGDIKYALWSNG